MYTVERKQDDIVISEVRVNETIRCVRIKVQKDNFLFCSPEKNETHYVSSFINTEPGIRLLKGMYQRSNKLVLVLEKCRPKSKKYTEGCSLKIQEFPFPSYGTLRSPQLSKLKWEYQ